MSWKERKGRPTDPRAEKPLMIRGVALVTALFSLGYLINVSLGVPLMVASFGSIFGVAIVEFSIHMSGTRPTFLQFLNNLLRW